MIRKTILAAALLLINFSLSAFESGRLNFELIIEQEATNLNRFFYPVLPGDTISLSVISKEGKKIVLQHDDGILQEQKAKHWKYIAPQKKGNYTLTIIDEGNNEKMIITIFVMLPSGDQKGEYLNGYRIGNYPEVTYKNRNKYKVPEGFIEVTEANKDLYITPHFQLKQFLCKQASGWPKYMVLSPRLLIKLEQLLMEINKMGIQSKSLFIMSGYRTPYYNHAIGNVKFSRHVFGDAADIYVDEDGNSNFDDLNKDGKITMQDAEIVYNIVNKMDNNPDLIHLLGGMGKYNKNTRHTFFIHVDTRGYKARW
jgi:hypothetical protein